MDTGNRSAAAPEPGVTPRAAVKGCALLALVLCTLLGNVLVCAAVIKFRHLRSKVTNVFVISLAASDLLVASLVMPWKAIAEVAGYWPFGSFCNIWVAFDITCSTASILNLCIISVDRYWAIASPFRYERRMTRRVALTMVCVAWLLSLLISFVPVQLNWHRTSPPPRPTAAPNPAAWDNCDASLNTTYAISSSLVSFYIPVAIMIVTYTRIFLIAQRQIRRISALEQGAPGPHVAEGAHELCLKTSFKKETRVLKTLSVIMGVFVCCWLPFFVLNCAVPLCEAAPGPRAAGACVSDTTFSIFTWFGWANSALNPIVYAFNSEFRKAFATLLGCHRFCSSNSVEAVNLSNEIASYHRDTTLLQQQQQHRDGATPRGAGAAGRPPADGAEREEETDIEEREEEEEDASCVLMPAMVNLNDGAEANPGPHTASADELALSPAHTHQA